MSFIDDMAIRLEQRRRELEAEIGQIDKDLRQPHSADDEERALETEGDEVLEGLGNAHLKELQEIEAALKRIELGTYGICTTCGEPIDRARLEALPYTNHGMCPDCPT